jgi:hypothetical protein
MPVTPFTIIDEQRPTDTVAERQGGQLWLAAEALEASLGWKLEPRGLCRGPECIPTAGVPGLVSEHGVELAALAALLERPLAVDAEEGVAALAAPARARAARLESLEAPDFALPDLAGRVHRLSEHRGKKVLLIAYASW